MRFRPSITLGREAETQRAVREARSSLAFYVLRFTADEEEEERSELEEQEKGAEGRGGGRKGRQEGGGVDKDKENPTENSTRISTHSTIYKDEEEV